MACERFRLGLAKTTAILVPRHGGSVCLQVVPFVELERVFLKSVLEVILEDENSILIVLRVKSRLSFPLPVIARAVKSPLHGPGLQTFC